MLRGLLSGTGGPLDISLGRLDDLLVGLAGLFPGRQFVAEVADL